MKKESMTKEHIKNLEKNLAVYIFEEIDKFSFPRECSVEVFKVTILKSCVSVKVRFAGELFQVFTKKIFTSHVSEPKKLMESVDRIILDIREHERNKNGATNR